MIGPPLKEAKLKMEKWKILKLTKIIVLIRVTNQKSRTHRHVTLTDTYVLLVTENPLLVTGLHVELLLSSHIKKQYFYI